MNDQEQARPEDRFPHVSSEPDPTVEFHARIGALEHAVEGVEESLARQAAELATMPSKSLVVAAPDPLQEREARATPLSPAPESAITYTGNVAALFSALSLAQEAIRGAVKDSTNPHLHSSYADLASVWEAVRPHLAKEGLAVIQMVSPGGAFSFRSQEKAKDGSLFDRWWMCAAVEVVTVLAHNEGGYIEHRGTMTAVKAPGTTLHQAIGAAATYLRRYQLAAVCGVPQVDDDGNGPAEKGKDSSATIRTKTKKQEG
jgi:hypothetical protein